MTKQFSLENQIHFLGGRDDVTRFLIAADLMIHPAYSEGAGIVLLEAMMFGLPVLTNEVCGYAEHVGRAKAGIVISEPFQQYPLNVDFFSNAMAGKWVELLQSTGFFDYAQSGSRFY